MWKDGYRWNILKGEGMTILIKIIVATAFFVTLLLAAVWAGDKLDEYWGDDEDGR